MSTICHIVPSIPPEFNGLGDYCYQLWKHWPEPKPEWEILATRRPAGAREFWPEAKIHEFRLSRVGLEAALWHSRADTVVLHYVGYAYARRGVPSWLPKALADWKAAAGGRLVVMFHELYAVGPPWSSVFWLCLAQMGVARKLALIADSWVTSCPSYMAAFRKYLRVDISKGIMIPIGTTIEPIRAPSWDRPWPPANGGKLRIVIFGMPLTRLRTLRIHQHLLKLLYERGLIESLTLAGKSDQPGFILDETNSLLAKIECTDLVQRSYDLASPDVSAVLLDQDVGLIHNPYGTLTKSTVYGAYRTHGLLTVIPPEPGTAPGPYVVNDDRRPENCLLELGRKHAGIREGSEQFLFEHVSAKFAETCRP